ncbi:uncharacterized protein LOC135162957 [Diachasmimorpha longicaudata]|uniref:uncharacterized protein LOC135162957 n=1 Tax=Diachasmimorpha longicaudata TaxID=58733 RepID=UPI0030B8FE28
MKSILGVTILCCILLSNFCNAKLLLVQVLARYTETTPMSTADINEFFPEISDFNVSIPEGWNHLTMQGRIDAVDLGYDFRFKYESVYRNHTTYYRAMNAPNAIETARLMAIGASIRCLRHDPRCLDTTNQTNLDSMFNSISKDRMEFDVKKMREDKLFFSNTICKNYGEEFFSEIKRQSNEIDDTLSELYDDLSYHTGANFTTCAHAWILYQYLQAKASVGLPLESWTEDIFPDGALKNLTIQKFQTESTTDRMRRLLGGSLLSTFLKNIDDYKKGLTDHRLFVYVGDDYHIVGLLNALGMYDGEHIPNYGSYVELQLHELPDENKQPKLFLVIRYKSGRDESAFPLLMEIPGCFFLCSVEQVTSTLQNNILEDFDKDCRY